jgi:SAM-dependent MidA family methyltransferase
VTALADKLRERIAREGPITFYEWMRAALYDEREGYYRRSSLRWGRKGDYRTSPERSVLFARTFARYFAFLYDELGGPRELVVIESGGGTGEFARRVLETLERDRPDVFAALLYIFEESGEDSRTAAAEALAAFADRIKLCAALDEGTRFAWGIAFANELLDAFAVHRVVKRGDSLKEFYVDVDAGGAFVSVERELSTPPVIEYIERSSIGPAEGQIVEVNLEAERWIERARSMLVRGFVIAVDYGDTAANLYAAPFRREGTLRAFSRHNFVEDFLQRPGEVDLTTTVNWSQIVAAGERSGLRTVALERQDKFLLSAGLLEQLEREASIAESEAELARLRLDAREMILPGGMGERFQVLVLEKR